MRRVAETVMGIIFLALAAISAFSDGDDIKLEVGGAGGGLGQVVQGEFVIEVKRGIIDMKGERGILPQGAAGFSSKPLAALNKRYGLLSVERLFSGTRKDVPSDIYVFRFPKNVDLIGLRDAYEKDESVIYIEPNHVVRAMRAERK